MHPDACYSCLIDIETSHEWAHQKGDQGACAVLLKTKTLEQPVICIHVFFTWLLDLVFRLGPFRFRLDTGIDPKRKQLFGRDGVHGLHDHVTNHFLESNRNAGLNSRIELIFGFHGFKFCASSILLPRVTQTAPAGSTNTIFRVT
mgnify:CR=1 FL=1